VQCSAVQCSAVQCSAVQCSAVQCSAEHPSSDTSPLADFIHSQGPQRSGWKRLFRATTESNENSCNKPAVLPVLESPIRSFPFHQFMFSAIKRSIVPPTSYFPFDPDFFLLSFEIFSFWRRVQFPRGCFQYSPSRGRSRQPDGEFYLPRANDSRCIYI
jgi:hypothetical protein